MSDYFKVALNISNNEVDLPTWFLEEIESLEVGRSLVLGLS